MKISGYTTSRNSVSLDYSLKECVQSMLQFADEIIVADSTDIEDGTRDLLNDLEKSEKRIKVYHRDLDYSAPNHGILDGENKAYARSKCTGDWLFQIDNDEIVHEIDATKVKPLCQQLEGQTQIQVVALPEIEYWGSLKKVRIDVNPWKERLSRNNPNFTHGIPVQARRLKDGLLYSAGGDGCNMIDKNSGNSIQITGFMNQQAELLRQVAVRDFRYVPHFEHWFNDQIEQLPGVHHFSWFSIERKIETYKKYWNKHWQSLFGETLSDNDMFFDVPWEQVTPEMIKAKAKELRENTGGHVFHQKYTRQKTNHITVYRDIPTVIKEWVKEHTDE